MRIAATVSRTCYESVAKEFPKCFESICEQCCETSQRLVKVCRKCGQDFGESVAKVLRTCCEIAAKMLRKGLCFVARAVFSMFCGHSWYSSEVLIFVFVICCCCNRCVFVFSVCFCHFCFLSHVVIGLVIFFWRGMISRAKAMTRETISLPDPLRERNRQMSFTA